MTIYISGRQFELTESIEDRLRKSLSKNYHFVGEGARFDATVERSTNHHKKGDVYKIHVILKVGGRTFNAEAHGEDPYTLADEVSQKLESEIKKGGEKRRTLDRLIGRKFKDAVKRVTFWRE